jgi:hypothetical protein
LLGQQLGFHPSYWAPCLDAAPGLPNLGEPKASGEDQGLTEIYSLLRSATVPNIRNIKPMTRSSIFPSLTIGTAIIGIAAISQRIPCTVSIGYRVMMQSWIHPVKGAEGFDVPEQSGCSEQAIVF